MAKTSRAGASMRLTAVDESARISEGASTQVPGAETIEPGVETPARCGRGHPKVSLSPDLLADCRCRFETTADSVQSIALACKISPSKVYRLAKEYNWTRFRPAPLDLPPSERLRQRAAALAEAVQSRANSISANDLAASADDVAAGIADVIAGVRRVLANINAMQARMADEQTPLDVQRLAQTYASLNGTLRDLQRAQHGPQPVQHAGYYDDDIPADIDAFRDALAQRIENFVASRCDEELRGQAAAAGDDAP